MLVAVLVTLLGDARASDQTAGGSIRYRDDRMSVDVQGAPLADVIDELGRQSGASIRGRVRKPRELSLSFDDVPLPDALERVLGEQNFTLRYGSDGRLEAVELLGEPEPLQSPAAAASGTSNAASLQSRGLGGAGAPTVEQGSRSTGLSVSVLGGPAGQASAPGSPAMVGGGLQATAQGQPSSKDQQQADLSDAELQQRIRRTFLNSLGAMDDASLAALMDTPEGRRIQALLQFYADHHVGSHRQQQASDIMGRLPQTGAGAPAPAPGSPSESSSHHAWH